MRYQWHCLVDNQRLGPFTAVELKNLVSDNLVHAWYSVEVNGCTVVARQIEGLFPPSTILEVAWAGQWMLIDTDVAVTLNNDPVYQGSFVRGFRHPLEVQPGSYTVGFKIPMRGQKKTVLEVTTPGVYSVQGFYSTFWGNFTDKFQFTYEPPFDPQASQYWREEYQAARCERCQAEWAMDYVSSQVIREQPSYETLSQREQHLLQNPNEQSDNPYASPVLQAEPGRETQMVKITKTTRSLYRCCRCAHQQAIDNTSEYIP